MNFIFVILKMEVFDVFVRNYEDGKPLITLTVNAKTTIGKLKKDFAEQCNFLINLLLIL